MSLLLRVGRLLVIATVLVVTTTRAWADEADNFTCRGRISRDSLATLDGWVNARIDEAIARANRGGREGCDAACLIRLLQDDVGGSTRRLTTFIPESRLGAWIQKTPSIERCHLEFRDTIYGARPYSQPWLFPFLHRIIFVADSIRVADHVIGLDKVDHFIREGLDHWRWMNRTGGTIAQSMARELGAPHRQLKWTEWGVKGMSLTGVLAYADLAAGYFGYRFWNDALALEGPASFVAYDPATKQYTRRRAFTFADFVNDAWDEAINCSTFDSKIGPGVAEALQKRGMTCGGRGQALAVLPDSKLYVNPKVIDDLSRR